jgi:hypothetical protein
VILGFVQRLFALLCDKWDMPKFVVFRHTVGHQKKRATLWRQAHGQAGTVNIIGSIDIVDQPCETTFLQALLANSAAHMPFAYLMFADDVPDDKALAIAADDPPLTITLIADEATRLPTTAGQPRTATVIKLANHTFIANGADIVYCLASLKDPVNINTETTPRHIGHGNLSRPIDTKYIEGMYRLASRRLPWAKAPETATRTSSRPTFSPISSYSSNARAALISIIGTPPRIGNASLAARDTNS